MTVQSVAPRSGDELVIASLRAEVARLTSELALAKLRLGELEIRDRVTGLVDARETLRLLRIELDRCRRYDRILSVVLVEIEGYAAIVDRLGRHGADQVVARVARACRAGRRSTDVVGRLEGGQFLLVLPETPPESAAIVADHVRRHLATERSSVEASSGWGVDATAHLRFGVVGFPGNERDGDALIAAARRALTSR